MTVMAMEVISAEKHPNADALRRYMMLYADTNLKQRIKK